MRKIRCFGLLKKCVRFNSLLLHGGWAIMVFQMLRTIAKSVTHTRKLHFWSLKKINLIRIDNEFTKNKSKNSKIKKRIFTDSGCLGWRIFVLFFIQKISNLIFDAFFRCRSGIHREHLICWLLNFEKNPLLKYKSRARDMCLLSHRDYVLYLWNMKLGWNIFTAIAHWNVHNLQKRMPTKQRRTEFSYCLCSENRCRHILSRWKSIRFARKKGCSFSGPFRLPYHWNLIGPLGNQFDYSPICYCFITIYAQW